MAPVCTIATTPVDQGTCDGLMCDADCDSVRGGNPVRQGTCHGTRKDDCNDGFDANSPASQVERQSCRLAENASPEVCNDTAISACTRQDVPPRLLIQNDDGGIIEAHLRMNDFELTLVADRNNDGVTNLDVRNLPDCGDDDLDDGVGDCVFVKLCMDLFVDTDLEVVPQSDPPSIQLTLRQPIASNGTGVTCGGWLVTPPGSQGAVSGAVDQALAQISIPPQTVQGMDLGLPDCLTLTNVRLFAAETDDDESFMDFLGVAADLELSDDCP